MSTFIQQVIDAVQEMHTSKQSQKLYKLKFEIVSERDILDLINLSVQNSNDSEALFYLLCALDDILSNSIYTKRFCVMFKSSLNQYIQHILQRSNTSSEYEIYCQKEYSKVVTTISSKSLLENEAKEMSKALLSSIKLQKQCIFLLLLLDRFLIQCILKYKYHSFDDIIYETMVVVLEIIFEQQKVMDIQILKGYYNILYTCIKSYGLQYQEQKAFKCIVSNEQLNYLINFFLLDNQAKLKQLFIFNDPQIFELNQELLQLICGITRLAYISNNNIQSFIIAILNETITFILNYESTLLSNTNQYPQYLPSGLLITLILTIGTQTFVKTITEVSALEFGVTFDLQWLLVSLKQILLNQLTNIQFKISFEDQSLNNIIQFYELLLVSYIYLKQQEVIQLFQLYQALSNILLDFLDKITFNNFMSRTFHSLLTALCNFLLEYNQQQYKLIEERLQANYYRQQSYYEKVLFFANFSNENLLNTWMFEELLVLIDVQLQQNIQMTSPQELQIQFQTNEFLVISLWELSMKDYKCSLGNLNIKTQQIILLYLIKLLQFSGTINSFAYKYYNSYNQYEDKIVYIQNMDLNKIASYYGPINYNNIYIYVKILKEKIKELDIQLMYNFGNQLYECGLYQYIPPEVIKFIIRYEQLNGIQLIHPAYLNIRITTLQYQQDASLNEQQSNIAKIEEYKAFIPQIMQAISMPIILSDINILKDFGQERLTSVQKSLLYNYIDYVLLQLQNNTISKEELNSFLESLSEIVRKYVLQEASSFYTVSDDISLDTFHFISYVRLIYYIQQLLMKPYNITGQRDMNLLQTEQRENQTQLNLGIQYDILYDGLFTTIFELNDDLTAASRDIFNITDRTGIDVYRKALNKQLLMHGIVPLILNKVTIDTACHKILINNQLTSNQAKLLIIQISYLLFGEQRQCGNLSKFITLPSNFFEVLNSQENETISIESLQLNVLYDNQQILYIEEYFNQQIIYLIAWMFNVYSDYNTNSQLYISAICEICQTIQQIRQEPMIHYHLLVTGYKYYYQQIYGVSLDENYLLNQLQINLSQQKLVNTSEELNGNQILSELKTRINTQNVIHNDLLECVKYLFTYVPQ